MNKKITPYIYILFFCSFLNATYSQEKNILSLKARSLDSVENKIISKIEYRQKFTSESNLHAAKDSILTILKESGYYTSIIDSITVKNNHYNVFFKLGAKTNTIHIYINPKDSTFLSPLNFSAKNNVLILKSNNLKSALTNITTLLINQGKPFSKVKLTNTTIQNQILYAELSIIESRQRNIDRVILKGYEDFPKSYIKNYLNLKSTTNFNQNEIEKISQKINQLKFANEAKKPEILFSKDSTLLYLYIDKVKSNSFDGLINFATENKKLTFKGYLDLDLNNVFNKGEEIKIKWKNNGSNKQDLTITNKTPYILGSKITSNISFNLYRHDSSYVNSKFNFALTHAINNKLHLSLLYNYENSKSNIPLNNVSNFKKNLLGLGFNLNTYSKNQFLFDTNILYGIRNSTIKTTQYYINLSASGFFNINKKTKFVLHNKSAILISDSFLENELLREGGTNSIRGFNEQSIYTSKYSYINSEVRFATAKKSSIYTIHDIGLFNMNNTNNVLYSLGIGYDFYRNSNSINISYTIGNSTNSTTMLKSTILSIKTLTLF